MKKYEEEDKDSRVIIELSLDEVTQILSDIHDFHIHEWFVDFIRKHNLSNEKRAEREALKKEELKERAKAQLKKESDKMKDIIDTIG